MRLPFSLQATGRRVVREIQRRCEKLRGGSSNQANLRRFSSDFQRYSSCTKARNARASRPRTSPHADDQQQSKGANDERFEGSSGSRRARSRRAVRSPALRGGGASSRSRSRRTSRRSSRPSARGATTRLDRADVAHHLQEARPWARSIKDRVATRQMPPWHIDRSVGVQKFKNDMSLSDEQVDTIVAGSTRARSQGNPEDMPPAKPVVTDNCTGR